MKTTTIKINHPVDGKVMGLTDLKEATFRISEQIDTYWKEIEECMAYLKDDDRNLLANNCAKIIQNLHEVAWRIDRVHIHFGDLPF